MRISDWSSDVCSSDLLGDAVGGEARGLGMPPDEILARRAVDAVDLVVGNVAMDPLDFRAQVPQHAARALRRALEVVLAQLSGARHLSFNHELRHRFRSLSEGAPDLRPFASRVHNVYSRTTRPEGGREGKE